MEATDVAPTRSLTRPTRCKNQNKSLVTSRQSRKIIAKKTTREPNASSPSRAKTINIKDSPKTEAIDQGCGITIRLLASAIIEAVEAFNN